MVPRGSGKTLLCMKFTVYLPPVGPPSLVFHLWVGMMSTSDGQDSGPLLGRNDEFLVLPCAGCAAPPLPPPPPPIFGHRRAAAAAAVEFLVGAPPTQYIEVSIFSWTVL